MSKSRIIRNYPIRTTSNGWRIHMYCKHKCGPHCVNFTYRSVEHPGIIYIRPNPDHVNGKCPRNKKLEKIGIHLASFDPDNTDNMACGPLVDADKIIIPDSIFKIEVTYPLTRKTQIIIAADSEYENGFKLKQIIYLIRTIYKCIYQIEERTATPLTYKVRQPCDACLDVSATKFLKRVYLGENSQQECCICNEIYSKTKKPCKLNCQHIFHRNCIKTWLESGSNTCPICRQSIVQCKECDNTRVRITEHMNVVVPTEHRGYHQGRNHTDGEFGIYDVDFEDLTLCSMEYRRTTKTLLLQVI